MFVLCGHLIDLRFDGAGEVRDGELPADTHADATGGKILDVFDHGRQATTTQPNASGRSVIPPALDPPEHST